MATRLEEDDAQAQELKEVLWRGLNAQQQPLHALLAPFATLLRSSEPVMRWGASTILKLSTPVWLLQLKEHHAATFTVEEVLRCILATMDPALLRRPTWSVEEKEGHGLLIITTRRRASLLHWMLLLHCRGALSGLATRTLPGLPPMPERLCQERLEMLLRLGADPNATVEWTQPPALLRGAVGHSPLYVALVFGGERGGLRLAETLLAFGARLDPVADRGGLSEALARQPRRTEVLRLFRHRVDALVGTQHDTDNNGLTALHVLVTACSLLEEGAVADARCLCEEFGVAVQARTLIGNTAADLADMRVGNPADPMEQWAVALARYLRSRENAELREARIRMSAAVHHALARLTPELRGLVANEYLPRDRFERFGRV